MNKFVMELVWHNCLSYPPKETWNKNLYITDGTYISKVWYDKQYGWWEYDKGDYIPQEKLNKHWWADLEQTIQNVPRFRLQK